MGTRIGRFECNYSARGIPSYHVELWHEELKKHRLIRGAEESVVRRKAELQAAEWASRWAQVEAREGSRQSKESKRQLAMARSEDAERELSRLSEILRSALAVSEAIDWEGLKDRAEFPEPRPTKLAAAAAPVMPASPAEPRPSDAPYQPHLGILDKLVSSRRERLVRQKDEQFRADHARWKAEVTAKETLFRSATEGHAAALRSEDERFKSSVEAWEQRGHDFLDARTAAWAAVDGQRDAYLAGTPEMIIEYCDMVLSASDYPDYFPKEFDLDYNPVTKILIVEYSLPAPDALPTVKEVKYVQSRDELVEQHLPASRSAQLYDDVVYQVILRTVHELFDADTIGAIDVVSINGWVRSIDRSMGREVNACIVSLQAQKGEFQAINLQNVDPKACFKTLKGVGSSKLHGLAAIAPIIQIRREDGRFVSAREVADTLDAAMNLAAMDWEEFEHLIREIFEKEFSANGGEVKVTRASRDGGVDAVAFDPDPIRGGKIVIQAKRYAHTVGVGAVRDLYGTLLNEGANKGILVTTSDYGPDAYAFANGKPLTLMNGSNLLYLLEKHGHKARIDLEEARAILNAQPAKPNGLEQ
jgi:restriction system protein